jgi:L,D-peptidoglycan transpeptidase YkuD (ErfK/YbiS/YcfS/YnhG family)
MREISVAEFETKVLEQEEILIKVRASVGTKVKDYDYSRKASGNQSTTDWLEGRIKPCLEGIEVVVIDGDYSTPHGRTKLDTLRASYEK